MIRKLASEKAADLRAPVSGACVMGTIKCQTANRRPSS